MRKVARDRIPIEVRGSARLPFGMAPARFLRDHWQKRPLLVRDAFAGFVPPLSADDLAGLACEELALSRIVLREHPPLLPRDLPRTAVRRGVRNDERWSVRGGPFQEPDFSKFPESHWTLLVQDVDKWDADVASLLARFDFLPDWRIDDVMVSFATDGGGVGAHVDQYDVFLLQGSGQRRWRINADPGAPRDFRDDLELNLLREFRPSHEWTLDPGDMLYLPPGVPHDGVAIGECMTFSIGMRAPSSAELLVAFAERVAAGLPESRRYSDPDLEPSKDAGEIDCEALRRARSALGPAAQMMDAENFADFFGRFITAYRSAHPPVQPKRRAHAGKLGAELPCSVFERNSWSRFAWRRGPRGAVLYASGEQFACPLPWARALCGRARTLDGAQLAKLPARESGVKLLTDLINAGDLSRKPR